MSLPYASQHNPLTALFVPDTRVATALQALELNVQSSLAVCQLLKSSLGPNGLSKMLIDKAGNIIITNDGARIVHDMIIVQPAAKMFVEIARTQEKGMW